MSRNVAEIIIHPAYKSQSLDNDLALIKLESPIEFTKWEWWYNIPSSTIIPPPQIHFTNLDTFYQSASRQRISRSPGRLALSLAGATPRRGGRVLQNLTRWSQRFGDSWWMCVVSTGWCSDNLQLRVSEAVLAVHGGVHLPWGRHLGVCRLLGGRQGRLWRTLSLLLLCGHVNDVRVTPGARCPLRTGTRWPGPGSGSSPGSSPGGLTGAGRSTAQACTPGEARTS